MRSGQLGDTAREKPPWPEPQNIHCPNQVPARTAPTSLEPAGFPLRRAGTCRWPKPRTQTACTSAGIRGRRTGDPAAGQTHRTDDGILGGRGHPVTPTGRGSSSCWMPPASCCATRATRPAPRHGTWPLTTQIWNSAGQDDTPNPATQLNTSQAAPGSARSGFRPNPAGLPHLRCLLATSPSRESGLTMSRPAVTDGVRGTPWCRRQGRAGCSPPRWPCWTCSPEAGSWCWFPRWTCRPRRNTRHRARPCGLHR